MQSSELNYIWLSEKRLNLLHYLQDGSKDIDQIKSYFDVNSRLIVPEIKKLIKAGIIIEAEGLYKLSSIGELNLENLQSFIDTAELIEIDPDYWENNDLTQIPEKLYRRIGELKNSELYVYDLDDIFDCPDPLRKTISTAKEFLIYMPFLPPTFPSNFLEPIKNGKKVCMILTRSILEKMEKEFPHEYELHLNSPNCQLFVCEDDILRPMIVALDNFLLLGFFKKDGIYGNKELMSNDKKAIEWGQELCRCYIGIAEPVTKN